MESIRMTASFPEIRSIRSRAGVPKSSISTFDGSGEELRGDQSVQLLRHHWIRGLVGKDRRIGEQAFGTVREMGVEAGDEVLWSCLGFGVAGGEREQKECGGEQRDEFQVAD